MIEIIPSILTNDPEEAKELIASCEGIVERVSVDIIDGKFADNKTIDPSALSDIDTSVAKIDPTILTNLDVVLVMSVAAGFGGQEFDKRALGKIRELDEIRVRDDTPYKIHDDGGITLDSIYNVHRVGSDEVSIGRRIFEGDLAENLKKFQKAAHGLGTRD